MTTGIFGLLDGSSVLVVGVEDDPEPGLLRVYIGARYNGTFVLVSNPEDQERIRNAWGSRAGHVFIDRPPSDLVFVDTPTTQQKGGHDAG